MLTQEQIDDRNCWKDIDVNQVSWDWVSAHHKLSESFIRKFQDKVGWNYISRHQKLSEEFIKEFQDKVDWNWVSANQQLSEEFIREFQHKVDWNCISRYQKLSEDFIREFQYKVEWDKISAHQKLSESFIREFKDEIGWYSISIHQKLSESFIREFQDKVNWDAISTYQKLSEEFIREFLQYKVDWYSISIHQKLSESFRKEFNFKTPQNNWLYATIEEKREKVKNHYELDGDYIIAYKSTRIDGYSVSNFQYHYEVGGVYKSHCDCNLFNENSFGLSAWTQKGALNYHSEGKLFKVRIHLNDLGAMTCNNKLRCFKLEVIEELQ